MHSAAEAGPSSVIRILTIPRVRAAACQLEFDEKRPMKPTQISWFQQNILRRPSLGSLLDDRRHGGGKGLTWI